MPKRPCVDCVCMCALTENSECDQRLNTCSGPGLIERTKAMSTRAIIMKPTLMAKMARAILEALGDEGGAAIGELASS